MSEGEWWFNVPENEDLAKGSKGKGKWVVPVKGKAAKGKGKQKGKTKHLGFRYYFCRCYLWKCYCCWNCTSEEPLCVGTVFLKNFCLMVFDFLQNWNNC